jgi:hypothetical protein
MKYDKKTMKRLIYNDIIFFTAWAFHVHGLSRRAELLQGAL